MPVREIILGVILFVVLTFFLVSVDAVDAFYEFTRQHEDWDLDEIIVGVLAALLTGLFSLIVALRRQARDLVAKRIIAENEVATKAQLVTTVSHELRTPMTAIRGALGMLTSDAVDASSEKGHELLGMAQRNVERLARIIDDILDVERIELGKGNFTPKPVDVASMVTRARDDNMGFAIEYGVELHVDALPGVSVVADEDRLMQVFSNLISNAVKFSQPGGEVRVGCQVQPDRIIFSVADRGEGIPVSFRDHVFDKFTRADNADSSGVPGNGIGLSITKAIVEAHGGAIWFDTGVSRGTTFYFYLPKVPLA